MPLIGTRGAASAQGFGEFAQQATAVQANAIDFDGTNDYLSRSSDLTGNTNSGTLTFSMFFWTATSAATQRYYGVYDGTGYRFEIYRSSAGQVIVNGYNLSNTQILGFSFYLTTAGGLLGTFVNLLFSLDLSNSAKRYVFINDTDNTSNVTWSTYSSGAINFSRSIHNIASSGIGTQLFPGRLSNVFLDYTYRDLSVTANRRLFVTADLKPAAGQAALNPILYLPMSDPTQPGLNQGTGGNFTLTGVVARSGRGPNQYNAPYATYNGTTQYVRKGSSMTGAADGKQFTFHCVVNGTAMQNGPSLFQIYDGNLATTLFQIYLGTRTLKILGKTNAGTTVLNATSPANTFVNGRNYVIDISIDMSNTANRFVYINGTAVSMTWTTYTNSNIAFVSVSGSSFTVNSACAQYDNAGEVNYFAGTAGAFWFNTSYIDLSVASNLAKFVTGTGIDAKPSDLGATGNTPTGSTPLVYLPMYGNAVGVNYGTGGNFNDISTVLPGARGPNEFWGNWATSPSGGWLSKSSSIGISDGKVFSFSLFFTKTASGSTTAFLISDNQGVGGAPKLQILFESGAAPSALSILAWNSAGTQILNVRQGGLISFNTQYHLCGYIDLTNTSNRGIYLNGSALSPTWTTYTNDVIDLLPATPRYWIGGEYSTPSADWNNTKIAEFYFTTTYIDFSQEANRLKFRDAFNNPTDLPSAITALTVPNPAVYMRFDPASFGTNSGTGGNFTVNGTITDGGQL